MTFLKERYTELLSLTQLFLLREYALTDVKIVDPTLLSFFRTKLGSSSSTSVKKTQVPSLTPSLPAPSLPTLKAPLRAITTPPSPDPRPPEILPEPLPPVHPEPTRPNPLPPTTPPEPGPVEPTPPIIHDKTVKLSTVVKGLTLEPLVEKTASRDQREFWKHFPQLFPDSPLCESIPSDAFAQKLKNAWLNDQVIPPVIILSFHNNETHSTFLKNVAKAISLHLAPARVLSAHQLEKEKKWESILTSPTLRLVIASDYDLYLHPHLMSFYREVPQQSKHFLNQVPLLLLSDLSLYLKDPQLKSLLWRAIRNEFAASQKDRPLHS